MNKLIITNCIDCEDNYPKDSHGGGLICTYESNDGIEVKHDGESFSIPDWCPKLKAQIGKYIITEIIPVDPEVDKMIDKHFSDR